MQAAEGAVYPSSPTFILDSAMGGNTNDPDLDFEFFDANLPLEAPISPGIFLPEDLISDSPQYTSVFDSPKIRKHPLISTTSFLDSVGSDHPVLSATVLTSPATSSRDSSSVSSRSKRKASGSDSSQSALTPGDTTMADDADMKDWKVDDMMTGGDVPNYSGFTGAGLTPFNGTIDPSKMSKHTFDFSDKSMENDFDFESAASSPSPFATSQFSQVDSPEMPAVRFSKQAKNSPRIKTEFRQQKMHAHRSTSINGPTSAGSREASPLSAMVISQESSPSAFFNSPSPNGGGVDYIHGSMLSAISPHTTRPQQFNSHNGLLTKQFQAANLPASLLAQNIVGQSVAGVSPSNAVCKPRLTVHPTPLKSRVETQLPIKMTLFPMPPGVTKLHLPKHTISKPKLLSKPLAEKSPDMLELSTMLVCSSAMQNPEKRRRAFARAARGPPSQDAQSSSPESQASDGTPDEDDESKPLNGGEVQICSGCITRERKRAARKKAKKAEDEEAWHKDEHRRVIVFNTHEIKDWQAPSSQAPSETTVDRAEPIVPEGAMQVDAPMRIACYCRHQNEKLGFQVIFTIKDYLGRLVAQEITSSIMITDDHKTHTMPIPNQDLNSSDGLGYPNQGLYPTDSAHNTATGSVSGMASSRMSHSSSDLQALQQQQYPIQFQQQAMNTNVVNPSQSTSGSLTPRNLSRQGSPSGSIGPSSKKRKASGSIVKVPNGLAMTRMENAQSAQNIISSLPSAAASSANSPYTTAFGSFQPSPEHHQFNLSIPAAAAAAAAQHFNTGPPTPNSNDNNMSSNANRSHSVENMVALHQLYSAPASSHPSRAPSPNGLRQQYQQHAQIAQAVANGLYAMPLSLNLHRPPTIHKLIPFEGPKAGGIEVTCLGSGFCQGLEVMFGENKATTTTYWGETSLVCLLPPAAFAGSVTVTFKHQAHQFPTSAIPKQQVLFKYVDDDEQQIIRTALSVLHHKMTGKMEDVRDLARRIVGDGPSSWNSDSQTGTQSQHGTNFSTSSFDIDLSDVEGSLLRVLDLIDLDDSPNSPRLNYRRPSGQTMLHLACSLGLHRFVAALIARGANPEPRDKGGFTPMHFAALHNHPQIVRRLILGGADPTMRSLLGYTPADLATSEEVLRATRRIEHHSRKRSNGSIRSRTSSVTSLRSLWEPLSIAQSNIQAPTDTPEDSNTMEDDNDEDPYNTTDGNAISSSEDGGWRRPSHSHMTRAVTGPTTSDKSTCLGVPPEVQTPPGSVLPTAAMAAIREQMIAHFQNIQQSMHLNFPYLPNLPPMQMPTLPDYQAYLPTNPMVKRISSMVPHMGVSRPSSADGKEQDYKWWDLFSGSASTAPPAYDDIFPDNDVAIKRSSTAQAATDAVMDNKCATLFDQIQNKTENPNPIAVLGSNTELETVRIGRKHPVSEEMQAKLRLAHAEKVKRIKSDRNLFFIWIPLLVVIILAMCYNRVPQATEFLRNRYSSQVVGVR